MSAADRREYDTIQSFLADSPYPITGVSHIKPHEYYGARGFKYFDDWFPYSIFYVVDEHEITVLLVLRSATKGTPR